jgi:alanine racemase
VNTLIAGEELGYGGAYRAERDERIATVGIGYADGFLRAYSGGRVVIHSESGEYIGEGKVVGKVCMDQCFISVGELDVKRGDIVTLMGEGGQIADLASKLGTVDHEIITVLSARLPRFVY